MRSIWSCSSCVVLLLFACIGNDVAAAHAGRQRKDELHRIAKAQVTAHPAHPARRDEGACPTAHSLCPASLSGDCCPAGYACATDSCYATTAGPTSACGRVGYYPCAFSEGGGCCPVGYVCGTRNQCIPPAGATITNTECPLNYFLCPSSVNYGCCMSGMGCARDACYSTAPVTNTVIQTITTTSDEQLVTQTRTTVTVVTPTPPSALPATEDPNVIAKFIPTSVPKVSASPSPDGGGGLSSGALGGIIAAVVILLIAVVIAAFFIIRRLKRVEEVMESRKGSSSGKKSKSQSQAQMEEYGRHLHSPTDETSIDPLMHATNTSISGAATPQPEATRSRSDSAGYAPNGRSRHASPDSSAGYFDHIPERVHNMPGGMHHQQPTPMTAARMRSDSDSNGQQQQLYAGYAYRPTHWRQQSGASELSADGSDNGANANIYSPLVSELDASGGYAELPSATTEQEDPRSRSSSAASVRGHAGGGSRWFGHVRKRSDSRGVAEGGITSPGPSTSPGVGLGLTPLDEAAEMHGYYGRRNQQAGQTAAGLDVECDVSSPVVPGYKPQLPLPPQPPQSSSREQP